MKILDIMPNSYKHFLIVLIGTPLLAGSLSCSHPVQTRKEIPVTKEAKPADQIISAMKTSLGLTDEQEVKIRPVIEEQVRKRNELIKKYERRNCRGSDCLKYELKELRVSTDGRLQYFLTNDQMIKYGNMEQEEDRRIEKMTSEKPSEEVIKEKPQRKGHKSGRF